MSTSPMTAMLSPARRRRGPARDRATRARPTAACSGAARRASDDVEAEDHLLDAGVEGEDALVALVEDDVRHLRRARRGRAGRSSRGAARRAHLVVAAELADDVAAVAGDHGDLLAHHLLECRRHGRAAAAAGAAKARAAAMSGSDASAAEALHSSDALHNCAAERRTRGGLAPLASARSPRDEETSAALVAAARLARWPAPARRMGRYARRSPVFRR